MITYIERRHKNFAYRILSAFIAFTFSFTSIIPPSYAQTIGALNLPVPGAMVTPSAAFVPVLLKGMTIHPDNPLQFDFIIDSGNTDFKEDQIKEESQRLVKYFLASMTIPKDDLWVNLSPYESDKIIPDELGKTELGRDMLAQDYILKQLTASLMYPEKELGKEFWNKVYQKAQEKYGTTEIPVDTFNKVWILPETATVYEHGQTVYIVEAKLKVMLDSDYIAQKFDPRSPMLDPRASSGIEHQTSSIQHRASSIETEIIREIILPEIEKEVNEGQNFAPLRQIYHSLILAKWYKETIKESLLSKVYVDQKKIAGVDTDDPTLKDQIYAQYMEAYKKGVFNYIKEDYDRLSNETIPRKYFSGGEQLTQIPLAKTNNPVVGNGLEGKGHRVTVINTPQKDGAAIAKKSSSPIIIPFTKQWYIKRLEHVDSDVRLKAILWIENKGKEDFNKNEYITYIIQKFNDEDNEVRKQARISAAKLGASKEQLVDGYIKALESSNPDVKLNAVNALDELGNEKAIEPLIKQLVNVTSFSFYIDNVINTLVKLGGKRQMVNEYYKALQSTYPSIRVFAAKTLAKINDAGPKNEGRVVILIEQKAGIAASYLLNWSHIEKAVKLLNDDGDFDVVFHPAEGHDEDSEWAEWVAIENYLLDDKIGGDSEYSKLRSRQAAIMQGRAQETPETSWFVDEYEPEWIEIVPKNYKSSSPVVERAREFVADLDGPDGKEILADITMDVEKSRHVVGLWNQLAVAARDGNMEAETVLREMSAVILKKLAENAASDNLKKLAQNVPAFNLRGTAMDAQGRQKVMMITGGTAVGTLWTSVMNHQMDQYIESTTGVVGNSDDGGSSYKVVSALNNAGYGIIPPPGDQVNALQGFMSADKTKHIMGNSGRLVKKDPSMLAGTLEAIRTTLTDISADENGVVLRLEEDFLYFARVLLSAVKNVDLINDEINGLNNAGLEPIKIDGASIRNLLLLGFLKEYGIIGEMRSKRTGESAINSGNEADYDAAVKDMARASGVNGNYISTLSFEPHTLYGLYSGYTMLLSVLHPKKIFMALNEAIRHWGDNESKINLANLTQEQLQEIQRGLGKLIKPDKKAVKNLLAGYGLGGVNEDVLGRVVGAYGAIEAVGIEEYQGQQADEVHLTIPSLMRLGGRPIVLHPGETTVLSQHIVDLLPLQNDVIFKNENGKIVMTINERRWKVVEEHDANITKLVSQEIDGGQEEIELIADGTGRRKKIADGEDFFIFRVPAKNTDANLDIFFRPRLVKTQTNLTETVNFLRIVEFGMLEGLAMDGRRPPQKYQVKINSNQKVIDEIDSTKRGDLIVIGPGSFFTSILPHFLVKGFPVALSGAKKRGVHIAMVLNGTKDNETVHQTPVSMLKELNEAVASDGIQVKDIFSFIIGGDGTSVTERMSPEEREKLTNAIGSLYGIEIEIRVDPGAASKAAKFSRGELVIEENQIEGIQELGIDNGGIVTIQNALYLREEKGRGKDAEAAVRALYHPSKIREAIVADIKFGQTQTASPMTQRDLSEEKQRRVKVLLEQPGGIESYPSTIRLMRDLRDQGIKVGVGTSSTNAVTVLTRLNAQDTFDVLVDGRIAKKDNIPSKPAREFYREVANRLDVEPQRSVVVEDAVSGVQSAVNGGFGFIIGLARENDEEALREAGADIVLRDIADLTVHEINVRLAEKFKMDIRQNVLQGVIFDMDGVISNTTPAHFQAWKVTFDGFLQGRQQLSGEPFKEFTFEEYKRYVSGRIREEAIRAFLESRGISIPTGDEWTPTPTPSISPTTEQGQRPMDKDQGMVSDELGGIDMNSIDLNRQGAGVEIQFDPAQLQEIIDLGIDGLAPVIINITPLPSVLPLLGLDPVNKEEELEVSVL